RTKLDRARLLCVFASGTEARTPYCLKRAWDCSVLARSLCRDRSALVVLRLERDLLNAVLGVPGQHIHLVGADLGYVAPLPVYLEGTIDKTAFNVHAAP